jgi:hypothetical protein
MSEVRALSRLQRWKDKRRGERLVADGKRSEEDQRWIDRLLDPCDGPASENAYPEGLTIGVDGKQASMNDGARAHNRRMGYVDKAADIPWTPEAAGAPGREVPEDDEE